jgi:hypothetical protein
MIDAGREEVVGVAGPVRALGGPSLEGKRVFGRPAMPAGKDDEGVILPLAGDDGRPFEAAMAGDIGRASLEARAVDSARCDPIESLEGVACGTGEAGVFPVGTRRKRSSSCPLSLGDNVPTWLHIFSPSRM